MTPELDLFGEVIPTYDNQTFTPAFFSEMHRLIDAGRRTREHHEWLRSQSLRWGAASFENLGNGWQRVTFWKD